jgi:hypothetical protein
MNAMDETNETPDEDLRQGLQQFAEKHPQYAGLSLEQLQERLRHDDDLFQAVNAFHDEALETARKAASEHYDGPDRRELWNFLEGLRQDKDGE